MARPSSEIVVQAQIQSRVARWLVEDMDLAPVRHMYVLYRADPVAGEHQLLQHPAEGISVEILEKRIRTELECTSGQQTFRIVAFGSDGAVLNQLVHKASGSAPVGKGDNDFVALTHLLGGFCNNLKEHYSDLYGQQRTFAGMAMEECNRLRVEGRAQRDDLEKVRTENAVERVRTIDPEKEAVAALWDRLGGLVDKVPAILAVVLKHAGGVETKALPPGRATDGGDSAPHPGKGSDGGRANPALNDKLIVSVIGLVLEGGRERVVRVLRAAARHPELVAEVEKILDTGTLKALTKEINTALDEA